MGEILFNISLGWFKWLDIWIWICEGNVSLKVGSNSWMVEADGGWSSPKATFINLAPFKVRDWSNLGLNLNISLFKHFLSLNPDYLPDLNLNVKFSLIQTVPLTSLWILTLSSISNFNYAWRNQICPDMD